ncbi:PREDICTED: uncharacterized protein LOC109126329 [Camelina sativa]|uniref:Uncharacterized protein LOC109126329 n=1 Tax=Camelina sativa TaxID=90675 RepID=A0ABM1QF35_CAMSA|nr:PREDICTED: uncharacterized protein LOC109126329 [Camelina sativa]
MASSPNITLESGSPLPDPKESRVVIKSLQYLSFTPPDIAFAVNKLSQFMHQLTDKNWQAAKHVLRYLAGMRSHGIFLKADDPLTIHAFSDADWGRDKNTYTSSNACIIYFGGRPISWSSKKQ